MSLLFVYLEILNQSWYTFCFICTPSYGRLVDNAEGIEPAIEHFVQKVIE